MTYSAWCNRDAFHPGTEGRISKGQIHTVLTITTVLVSDICRISCACCGLNNSQWICLPTTSPGLTSRWETFCTHKIRWQGDPVFYLIPASLIHFKTGSYMHLLTASTSFKGRYSAKSTFTFPIHTITLQVSLMPHFFLFLILNSSSLPSYSLYRRCSRLLITLFAPPFLFLFFSSARFLLTYRVQKCIQHSSWGKNLSYSTFQQCIDGEKNCTHTNHH